MKRKILLLKGFICLTSIITLCTSFKSSGPHEQNNWFCEDLKYTYQIEVENSRSQISVPSDICFLISSKRKKSELTIVQLDQNISLKIFSEDQISELELSENLSQIIYK